MAVSTSSASPAIDLPDTQNPSRNPGSENEASSSTASDSGAAAIATATAVADAAGAVTDPSAAVDDAEAAAELPLKRTLVDLEKGISCHQCRQKTRSLVVVCLQPRPNKLCAVKYCHKCLLNRYGERADEVAENLDWRCPKCRDICNCSLCMKKKGHVPTGILVHTARQNGFSSVQDLLKCDGDALLAASGLKSLSVKSSTASEKKRRRDKENSNDESLDVDITAANNDQSKDAQAAKIKKRLPKKPRFESGDGEVKDLLSNSTNSVTREGLQKVDKGKMSAPEEPVFPPGTLLSKIAGIDMAAEDIGSALQFLDFCNAFSEVFDIKEGEPESILRELAAGVIGCRGIYPTAVKFHMNLLSFIQEDMGEEPLSESPDNEDTWLQYVVECVNESEHRLSGSPLDCFRNEPLDYDVLSISNKLKLLNVFCGRVLDTENLRSWIKKENKKTINREKEAREANRYAKKKGKELQQNLRDKTTEAMRSLRETPNLCNDEHDKLCSDIKAENEKVQAEMQKSMESLPKKPEKQRRDFFRTEPVFLVGEGHAYWKIQGHCSGSNILLQDVGSWDYMKLEDKWFCYNQDEEKTIERHISSLQKMRRATLRKSRKKGGKYIHAEVDASINNPTPPNCSDEGSAPSSINNPTPPNYSDEGSAPSINNLTPPNCSDEGSAPSSINNPTSPN